MNRIGRLASGLVCFAAFVAAPAAQAGVYVRFTITKVRSSGGIQMSELAVYDKLANRVNLIQPRPPQARPRQTLP